MLVSLRLSLVRYGFVEVWGCFHRPSCIVLKMLQVFMHMNLAFNAGPSSVCPNSVPYQKVKVGPLCQNIMPPHARIQKFSSGGSRSSDKKSSDNVFFFFFFVHSRFYRRQMVNFKRFFILKSANGFTVVTRGFYSLCKFGHAVALITLNLCDLILLLKVKFGKESPVEP